METGALIQV